MQEELIDWGLSPRVRGNRAGCQPVPHRRRSIPACAGEPGPTSLSRYDKKVYPRVCGGTCQVQASSLKQEGLSPRVRGNLDTDLLQNISLGSIPACAGEPLLPR